MRTASMYAIPSTSRLLTTLPVQVMPFLLEIYRGLWPDSGSARWLWSIRLVGLMHVHNILLAGSCCQEECCVLSCGIRCSMLPTRPLLLLASLQRDRGLRARLFEDGHFLSYWLQWVLLGWFIWALDCPRVNLHHRWSLHRIIIHIDSTIWIIFLLNIFNSSIFPRLFNFPCHSRLIRSDTILSTNFRRFCFHICIGWDGNIIRVCVIILCAG